MTQDTIDPIPRFPKDGDWIQYVLGSGKNIGTIRYGFVVEVHSKENINIVVMTNGPEDFEEGQAGYSGVLWVQNVLYSADTRVKKSWHWPDE